VLTAEDTKRLIFSVLSDDQRKRFERDQELDFAHNIPGISRFRVNIFQQRNSMAAVFRTIPLSVPTLDELGLPKVCKFLAERPRGLVLVTGPTGSGKSTTLAAMINHINATQQVHIVTVEDPIEFVHSNQTAYINQREIGEDTDNFSTALRRVLRQDPDVIMLGELRDLETIAAAVTAAETGHLVFGTLHTTGAAESIERMVDVFPPHQQEQIRIQLAGALEGVLSQVLLRSADGMSRVLAMEVMLGTPAIANLIRTGKTHQITTVIQTSQALDMRTLDQDLKSLVQKQTVTYQEAVAKAKDPAEFAAMMGRSFG
jgi:twitching motility protein PilT